MAEQRGGYRRPEDRSPKVSGVGKNSKRTDTQVIASPNVQDSTDLQTGDRERIRQGQKVQRLGATPAPNVTPPTSGPRLDGPAMTSPGGGGEPPLHLAQMPTNRPLEDPMTPPSALPEEPQDDQEVVLQWLVDAFGDQAASQMLRDKRAARVQPVTPQMPPMQPEIEPALPTEEPEAIESDVFALESEPVEEAPEEGAEPSPVL